MYALHAEYQVNPEGEAMNLGTRSSTNQPAKADLASTEQSKDKNWVLGVLDLLTPINSLNAPLR